jgi:hypothetical protein
MVQFSGRYFSQTTFPGTQSRIISILFALFLGLVCLPKVQAQVWSNEIHYDNVGADVNESVEVAGVTGTSLMGWKIQFYDGSNGTVYATANLSGTLPNTCMAGGQNVGVVVVDVFAATGFSFQNGPDGWALVNPSNVAVEFWSYEGVFVATNGAANGMTSVDIGASETNTALVGSSIQRTGALSWVFGDGTNTFGACNTTQYNPNAPQPPSGNAGPDQEISVAQSATMAAVFANGTGAWSVFSGPSTSSAQFNNTASANAVFTPAGGPGTYVLRWTVTNSGGSVSDDMNVIVYPLPPAANLQLFSNEIHYQNTGTDINERIEIAGPAGTSLTNWRIQFYDGSNGQVYATANLSGTLPNSCTVNGDNIGVIVVDVFAATGINLQNGPDGWALIFGATPVEFLSYGGTFTATNGFANGMTSVNIGAVEPTDAPATSSIQRTASTTWVYGAGTNTFGACNSIQYNPNGPLPPASNAGPDREISVAGTATLAAIATNGTGAWSIVSGPSTVLSQISNLAAANATFTPAGGPGIYTLRWTVSAMGFPNATDDMTVTVFPLPPSQCDQIFSNEIHYQNVGADINEKIEFAGKAGTSLTNWRVQLYEGSNGTVITTINLSGTLPNTCTVSGINMGIYVVDVLAASGFTLGSGPDGWALVFGATPVEFWSYGGTFTATNGFAAGMTSTNIGATEPTNTSPNSSIQRSGLSTWIFAEGTNTFGSCNTTQYFCPEPVANAGPNQLFCSLTPATLAAQAFNGTGAWSVVSGPSTLASQFSSTTTANATFTPAGGNGTYTLRWTVTGSNGTATDDVQIVYSTPPTVNITGELVICPSGSRVLTASGGGTYVWSTGATMASITVNAAATYTVTVTNAAGCTATKTATTTILNAGSISATPNNTGPWGFWTCFGSTITLSSNGTPGGTWIAVNKSMPVVSVNQMGVVTPLLATIFVDTHTVAYRVMATGCAVSTFTTIEVRGLNAGTISGNTNICTGTTGNTTALTTDGAGGGTWSSSNTAAATVSNTGVVTSVAPGMTTISYTVTSQSCPNTATAVVTVAVCCAAPVAICQPATVILSGNSATLTAAAVNNNSTAACGLQSTTVSPNTFNCSHVGTPQTVTLTVTDINNTTSTCQTTVTVLDQTPPSITCPANTTVNANASCQGTVGIRLPTAVGDNCNASPAVTQSPAASTILSGHNTAQTVTLTANDGNGNTATCTMTVTLRDITPPSITCPANTTINANASCQGTVGAYSATTFDNCNPSPAVTQSPASSTLLTGHNSAQTITLTANDGNGNTATCTMTVTLRDVTPPSITCPANTTINANASCQGAVGAYAAASLSDNCNPSPVVTQSPASSTLLTGHNSAQTITLTANDGNGNTATCTMTVTLRDITPPSITCPANTTINANASCQGAVGAYAAASLSDNCNPSPVVTQSPASSTLLTGHNSTQTITLTANDGNGNTATCTMTVTLRDVTPPTITCPTNTTVNANASCQGTVGAYAAASLSDNCNPSPAVTQSPASSTLLTGHNSAQTITLTANDGNGNTATCTMTVTLRDITPPSITCPANTTINANASCQGTVGAYSATTFDNCNPSPAVTQSLAAATLISGHNSTQTVTLTANDGNGNTATCSLTVTLKDVTAPTVTCKPATVNLSAAGTGSVTTAAVFQSGADNCGTVNQVSVSPNAFTCSNLGANTVVLTVNDGNGNTATCSAIVTVVDVTPPTVTCVPKYEALLNAAGAVTVVPANVLLSATDNCGTVTPVSVTPNSFTCANLGGQIVTLTVRDNGNNTATCTSIVSVHDGTAPTMLCKAVTAPLNASGQASITTAQVNNGSFDNCTLVSLALNRSSFTCADLGANTVVLTGTDQTGNVGTCSAVVTVTDPIAPTALCRNATANLGPNGTVTILPTLVNNGSSDNCSMTLSTAPSTFTCANIGANTVSMTATDVAGNKSTCTAVVTVRDVAAPTALCKNATVFLNANGQGTLAVSQVNNNSTDNCGITMTSLNNTQYSCAELAGSPWAVTLTLKDASNNTSTCTAQVTVKDNIAPTAICTNTTVNLGMNGLAVVYPAQLASGSTDNCSVWSYSPTAKVYNSSNLGQNNLVITVKDWGQNAATCVSVVTVLPFGAAQGESDDREQEGIQTGGSRPTENNLLAIVYPNPTTGRAQLGLQMEDGGPVTLRIVDVRGRVVEDRSFIGEAGDNVFALDLSTQAAGIYVLDIVVGEHRVQKRLVVLGE